MIYNNNYIGNNCILSKSFKQFVKVTKTKILSVTYRTVTYNLTLYCLYVTPYFVHQSVNTLTICKMSVSSYYLAYIYAAQP